MVLLKSLPPPNEGVRHQQAETAAVLDGKELGTGTLYVAESRLSWFNGSGMGFSLEYPSISLHAISRDLSAYPQEHLYVMVNKKLDDENEAEMHERAPDDEGAEESDDDSEDGVIAEIRFVPSDKAALESMFSAMCDCQALHPDPEDEESDDEFEGEEYDVEEAEQSHGDIPTFYTYEEGPMNRRLSLKMEWKLTQILQKLGSLTMLTLITDGARVSDASRSTSGPQSDTDSVHQAVPSVELSGLFTKAHVSPALIHRFCF
ncbi:hypothetical protein AOLI_G00092680 [Acnodon oligacanthus]